MRYIHECDTLALGKAVNLANRYIVSIQLSNYHYSFQQEFILDRAIIILYLIYLLFIYLIIWKIFLGKMMDELWRAKSMLR